MSTTHVCHAPPARPAGDRDTYRPLQPGTSVLYQVVARHLATFLGQLDEDGGRADLPGFGPVRQWVLSLPFGLRFAVAFDRKLCRAVRAVFMDTVQDRPRASARAGARAPSAPRR